MIARLRIVIGIIALIIASVQSAPAQSERPLMQVASELGFTYSFMSAPAMVQLSRPGLVIVLRPGDRRYDVNERFEYASVAPRFASSDVYVTSTLVDRLRFLAGQYATAGEARHGPEYVAQAVPLGATLSLTAQQDPGHEAVLVSGSAPPSIPITVTAVGRVSRDLPDIVLSRTQLVSDAGGLYQASIPIAPLYLRDAEITFTASSLPGVRSASARYVIAAPNSKNTMPADNTPRVFF